VTLECVFPGLKGTKYKVTSEATERYNCIAWAARDSSNWWWPDAQQWFYWPEGAPREATIEAFVEAFRLQGFEVCEDDSFEVGKEKVAIFAIDKTPKHAARQLEDGTWTSKLGPDVDVMHFKLNDISGSIYGIPVRILRRPR